MNGKENEKKKTSPSIYHSHFILCVCPAADIRQFSISIHMRIYFIFSFHFHALLSKSRISFDTLFIGTTFDAIRDIKYDDIKRTKTRWVRQERGTYLMGRHVGLFVCFCVRYRLNAYRCKTNVDECMRVHRMFGI